MFESRLKDIKHLLADLLLSIEPSYFYVSSGYIKIVEYGFACDVSYLVERRFKTIYFLRSFLTSIGDLKAFHLEFSCLMIVS